MKFYAIKKGKKTGIFSSWEETKELTDKFPGAIFKSFSTKHEANEWLTSFEQVNSCDRNTKLLKKEKMNESNMNIYSAYTDGSYDKNTSKASYGVVILKGNKIISKFNGVLKNDWYDGRNVLGEIYGILKTLEFCKRKKINSISIYYDYQGLSSWINKEWKTTSKLAQVYVEKYKKITLENNIAVSFEKVKAHTGNIFNEIADKEAKKALGLNKSK